MSHSDTQIGRYRLIKRLAVGGMSDIYLAQTHGPRGYEKTVVVKTIRADLVEDDELIEMLLQEARIASCLNHESIVKVLEVGEEDGSHYLAMEFVFGRDLGQIRDRCQELGWNIPYKHVITMIADVLDALQHAHHEAKSDGQALKVIHRDVSPQNILIGFDGRVKLLDFGLAKAAAQISRTRAGVLKGKYAYMAPEQVSFKRIDQRADIFSTGVVLWEMLTEQRLFFRASDYETVQAVMDCRIPFPRRVRPELPWSTSWIAFRALRKNPRWRYATAKEVRTALLRHESRTPAEARNELSDWLSALFGKQLAQREMALTRARNDPQRYRQIMDAGFELLEEVTDPDLRLRPVPQPPDTKAPSRTRSTGFIAWSLTVLSTWKWFAVILSALVFFSIALGIYIGSKETDPHVHAFVDIVSDRSNVNVTVGTTNVGLTPVRRVPLMPGRHRIIGRIGGQEKKIEIQIKAGQSEVIHLTFEE